MRTPGFLEGVAVALTASVATSILFGALAPLFGGDALLRALIALLGLAYSLYLLRRSRARVGRVSVIAVWCLAALVLARLAVSQGELPAAQVQLQWALEHADSPELKHTARLRLVRVLMDQNQLAEAAQQLNSVTEAGAYAYLYTELQGDLAMLEGNTVEAASAYRQALDSMPAQAPNAALLSAKYDSVSGAGSATQ